MRAYMHVNTTIIHNYVLIIINSGNYSSTYLYAFVF